MINSQEENKKRLAKFMEKHVEHINDECDKYYSRIISKLSIPMLTIDDFSIQKDNLAEITTTIGGIT